MASIHGYFFIISGQVLTRYNKVRKDWDQNYVSLVFNIRKPLHFLPLSCQVSARLRNGLGLGSEDVRRCGNGLKSFKIDGWVMFSATVLPYLASIQIRNLNPLVTHLWSPYPWSPIAGNCRIGTLGRWPFFLGLVALNKCCSIALGQARLSAWVLPTISNHFQPFPTSTSLKHQPGWSSATKTGRESPFQAFLALRIPPTSQSSLGQRPLPRSRLGSSKSRTKTLD